MISLKELSGRVVNAERYLTTQQAINYINTQGSVSSTNNLAGLPLSHYNCNGGCSWTCGGGCSKGAGGSTRQVAAAPVTHTKHCFCGHLFGG